MQQLILEILKYSNFAMIFFIGYFIGKYRIKKSIIRLQQNSTKDDTNDPTRS